MLKKVQKRKKKSFSICCLSIILVTALHSTFKVVFFFSFYTFHKTIDHGTSLKTLRVYSSVTTGRVKDRKKRNPERSDNKRFVISVKVQMLLLTFATFYDF